MLFKKEKIPDLFAIQIINISSSYKVRVQSDADTNSIWSHAVSVCSYLLPSVNPSYIRKIWNSSSSCYISMSHYITKPMHLH